MVTGRTAVTVVIVVIAVDEGLKQLMTDADKTNSNESCQKTRAKQKRSENALPLV